MANFNHGEIGSSSLIFFTCSFCSKSLGKSYATDNCLEPQKQSCKAAASMFDDPLWFCVRAQPRKEAFAVSFLNRLDGIEVFFPQVKYRRAKRCSSPWNVEPLFPGYLFARFAWREHYRNVHYCPGILGIVHFGTQWPALPEATVDELKMLVGDEGIRTIEKLVSINDEVEIKSGPFAGFQALVTDVVPSRQRVAVLLDFLGRQTRLELPVGDIDIRALQPAVLEFAKA